MTYTAAMAQHGGAVLLGRKPAAMFALAGNSAIFLAHKLAYANSLALLPLRRDDERSLVLLYHPERLAATLGQPVPRRILEQLGYPMGAGLPAILAHLQKQLQGQAGFPHEVGFFLGYPPADVVGFMRFGGKGCKHSCMWKVYGDVEKAKRLCSEYEACNLLCRRHVDAGGDLAALRYLFQPALVQPAG